MFMNAMTDRRLALTCLKFVREHHLALRTDVFNAPRAVLLESAA
jgi:hypothetical protein